MKLKTIKLLAALAAVCCFSSAFADSVRVIGNEATIGSATQSSGGYRWEGGQSTMTITFETPSGCTEGDTLLFSELKMVSAGDDGNSYTGAYGRRLSIVVDDVTYTSGKVIFTSSSAIGELTGKDVLTYNFPNVPVKAGASYTLTLLDRPEGKTGTRYAVTTEGSIVYVGADNDQFKPIAVATVTPVLTSKPVAGSMILLSNTATSGAVSESGAGECNLTLSIPESDALPLGTVVRVKKINLASWNDTFKDWDTTNNKSDPYFIKVNNVKSLSIIGTTTDPGSAPTTDLTTATILANETTAFNRLSFAFAETCDLTVGTEYPAASGNNASTGVALLYRNGNLCYGGSQDRAAVRYVESDTPSILSSAAASGAYPIYEMYAEVLGNVTVKADETVSISELNTQAADAVLMVTIESGATVNIDATPVENVEFYGDNFSLYNGVVTANGVAVRVMEGATLANLGAKRDFSGWAVDDGVTVSITQTTAEYGKGVTTVMNAENVSAVTVLDPTGAVAGTITPASSTTLETSANVSGKACWYDWEMNGNLDGTGANTTGLTYDSGSAANNFYNSSMLYTYRHPYTSVTFPATWTAVVRCTVPKVVNGTVITFGTKFTSFIGLIAGDDPETEMKLVRYNYGDEAYSVLASIPIVDGTSAQHVYIFSVENNSAVKVYCDGSVVLDQTFDAFSLGGGIQIGSAHGGVAGGLVRMWAGDTYAGLTTDDLEEARIDCVRLYDYSLSAEQVAALATEFPAVKLYRATAAADADTTWGELTWSPSWDGGNNQSKVILTTEGDATVALPETITADQLQFVLAADSTLTLAGPGSLTVTEPIDIGNGTLELTGTVTLTQDTTFNGKVKFTQFTKAGAGAIKLSTGATVGVDAALVVTPLGDYTRAEGTVVDSSYTGDGVRLMPLASAACSLTSGTTVRYYSDATGVFDTFKTGLATDESLVYTILDGTDWSSYAGFMVTWGYYFDQAAGTIELAAATIAAQNKAYTSLSAAVADAAENAVVKLFRDSSEAITLNKAITLNENGKAFSGTLTGNGTLTFYAFRNNPSITFTDWTGTVVLPEFAADGTILNNYGVTGSTVVLKGITGGWLGETGTQTMDVYPVLQLDGNVTIKGFSTAWTYTFTEITGEGDFSLDPTDNSPKSATIGKVAKGFTGAINNGTTVTLTIGTLDREAGTSTEVDDKLLDTTGDVVVEALTVAGEPVDVRLVTKEDGIYVGAPVVAVIGETPYTSLADAVAAATDGDTVELVTDVTLEARVDVNVGAGTTITIDLGENTITTSATCANGSAFNIKSGKVTITNGSVVGVEGPTGQYDKEKNPIYECDVITVRSGAEVVVSEMEITIDSQNGACVYPFTGAKATILSGTYANTTKEAYQYKAAWTGMAVNQGNVATQLLFIEGGTFSQVNPALGDDSWADGAGTFLASGYEATETSTGVWTVSAIPAYAVTLNKDEHITSLSVNPSSPVAKGATVVVTVVVDDGYIVDEVEYAGITKDDVTEDEDEGTITFTMPNNAVTVTVTSKVPKTPVTPGAQTEPVETAEAAEAEAAKVVPSVPTAVAEALSDEQETAYKSLFEPKVVEVKDGETTKYAVEVALTQAAETAIKEEIAPTELTTGTGEEEKPLDVASLATATDDTEVNVATKPGIYYGVKAGSSLGDLTVRSCKMATSNSDTVTFPKAASTDKAMFWVIFASPTPVAVPSND